NIHLEISRAQYAPKEAERQPANRHALNKGKKQANSNIHLEISRAQYAPKEEERQAAKRQGLNKGRKQAN
ncbi:hypothetical protein OFM35_35055, partial [Escherichia coli]|nr:hypothetical protein [Escherichia coli]